MRDVNRMIQDLCRTPHGAARLRADPEGVFDEYGLGEAEREALRSGDPLRIVACAGAHPILVMHLLFALRPELAEAMSLKAYPALLDGDG